MTQYESAALAELAAQCKSSPETLVRVAVCRLLAEMFDLKYPTVCADALKLPLLKAEAAITAGDRNAVTLAVSEWYGRELEQEMEKARDQVAYMRRLITKAENHNARQARLTVRANGTQRA